jgi:AraC family ethanolamine operon transcriptional activator
MLAPPGVVDHRIHDADELACTIRSWDLECRNTGPPDQESHLLQIPGEYVFLTRLRIGAPMLQSGGSPPGTRSFAILDPGVHMQWCGQHVNADSLFSFPPGGSFDCVSGSDFAVMAFSLREEVLDEASAAVGLPEVRRLAGGEARAFCCPPDSLRSLQRVLRRAAETLAGNDAPADAAAARRFLRRELPAEILETTAAGLMTEPPSTSQERSRALKRALDYIGTRPREPIGVTELCSVVECHERTLRRAFLERFGLATRDYLQALRLNGAFRSLSAADAATTQVSAVAREWGFWHLGEFAGHYRGLFGERPSQTLKRTAANRAKSALTTGR